MSIVDRRTVIGGAAATLLAARSSSPARAQTTGPYTLPPLSYAASALEPHIDQRTMELHHDRHHQSYVNNLNQALQGHQQLAQRPLPEILANLGNVPETIRTTVRNNGGGHVNHTMFWQIMAPPQGSSLPSGDLAAALQRDFGSLDRLKEQFNSAGGRVFGSGWVFVTVSPDGRLALTTRPNQDTPLMDGEKVLLGNDVWEHAYYLKYQNRRAEYLTAWWNVVNWQAVTERYDAARAGTLGI